MELSLSDIKPEQDRCEQTFTPVNKRSHLPGGQRGFARDYDILADGVFGVVRGLPRKRAQTVNKRSHL
jgi:hypothetical protein